MLDLPLGVLSVLRTPRTFSEYVRQQIGLSLLKGPPLRPEVTRCIPAFLARMRKGESLRAAAREERDLHIPSILFMAITGRCNLQCTHCYTQRYAAQHMDLSLARRVLTEAYGLGVSIAVVSGGEPLLHRGFFDIPREMPDLPFLIFTNGTFLPAFLDEQPVSPNMLWLVSLDGPREWNDARRGPGMFDVALAAMDALRARGIPFGFSITLSYDNVVAATSPDFIASLVARGCRNGFFLEQIPHPPADSPLSQQIAERLALCRTALSLPIVGFPGDEVRFGGCQAGGEGIAHVSPDGFLEPCPAARLAVDSLADVSLETALSSPFFKEFREMKERVSQDGEACSYNGRSEAFEESLSPLGAHSTV